MYYRVFLTFINGSSKQCLGTTYESPAVSRESSGSQVYGARLFSTTYFVVKPEDDPTLIFEVVALGIFYHFLFVML